MKKIYISILVCVVTVNCTTIEIDEIKDGSASKFFKLPLDQQKSSYFDYDLEQQYGLFLYGDHNVHPAAIYLQWCFASNEERAADLLHTKLQNNKIKDSNVGSITYLFRTMYQAGAYNINENPELIELLRSRILQIRSPSFRDRINKVYNEILHSKSKFSKDRIEACQSKSE